MNDDDPDRVDTPNGCAGCATVVVVVVLAAAMTFILGVGP